MAILNFQKPDKVIMIDSSEFEGKFEFRPLEPGYGLTVGNALRRVLLSSLEGFAITSVKIDNVEHEFSTIPGVVEDVTEIILNLKQIRFKRQIEEVDEEKVLLSFGGQEQLKAADFQKFISGFQVLNPDLVICNMEKSVQLNMEITIEKGRGYVPAEENKKNKRSPWSDCDRFYFYTHQKCKIQHRKLSCRTKNRLRKISFRNHFGRIHPPERRTHRGCENPHPSLLVVLR